MFKIIINDQNINMKIVMLGNIKIFEIKYDKIICKSNLKTYQKLKQYITV